MRTLLFVVPLALACACAPADEKAEPAREDPGYVECVVPRPEVCTRDYVPVCGLRDTGIRCVTTPCDSWETKTYGNACTACSDPDVYGWRPGKCAVEGVVHGEEEGGVHGE